MDVTIVCGHYGSGKTNFSLNLALSLRGKNTVLIDMDVVNPYFRSGDYSEVLKKHKIDVVSPVALGTTVDAPFLSPAIKSAFTGKYDHVIIDVGGDDAGATALGVYSQEIKNIGYKMVYIINKYREQIANPDGAVEVLREIESASRLKATGIVNNSHLCNETTADTVLNSLSYANDVSQMLELPIVYTTVEEKLYDELKDRVDRIFPIKRIVLSPWEQNTI